VHDDQRLFEKLCLEGFQAGLAWITILRKRPAFREAFADFAIDVVAEMGDDDVERMLGDAGIVRHRGKITAAIGNARRAQELIAEVGSLDAHVWSFAPEPRSRPRSFAEVAATTPESAALSKDLKKRGWRFVGPTTVYAFMQAMGIVDDHVDGCWVPQA
jgi:DNA-3-methyladenine glycosylase I